MNVLIASDGSEHARAAAGLLARLPLPDSTRITLLNATPEPAVGSAEEAAPGPKQALRERIVETSRKAARAMLEEDSARLRTTGWEVAWRLVEGDPVTYILEIAEELDADLIAVGARGLSRLERLLMGSVSIRLLCQAPRSMLLARTPHADETPAAGADRLRILLAYDGGTSSRGALQQLAALPLGERVEVTLVGVVVRAPVFGVDLLEDAAGLSKQARAAMQASLAEGVTTLRRATSRVSSVLREGTNAAEEIVAAARETEAELVVVGSRVPDGVQRFFPVGTASRIANHAPCSVWVERVRVESG